MKGMKKTKTEGQLVMSTSMVPAIRQLRRGNSHSVMSRLGRHDPLVIDWLLLTPSLSHSLALQ